VGKTILFSDGTSVEMTFEEVRTQFMPMVFKSMKRANNKFIFNQVEEDDFKQELELELWRAYEAYDADSKNCFSTYLHYKLMKGVRNATYSRYAQKNQSNGVFSMSAPIGDDDLKIEDMIASDDTSFDNIARNELLSLIMKNVKEDEMDLLNIIIDVKANSVNDYAEKFGLTRQAANQRVNKLKKKLRAVIAKEYLEIA
jgi:RNA polymerase sigma factor (sigma-70 family)